MIMKSGCKESLEVKKAESNPKWLNSAFVIPTKSKRLKRVAERAVKIQSQRS